MKGIIKIKYIISLALCFISLLSTCFAGCGGNVKKDEFIDTPIITPVKTANTLISNKTTATPKATKVVAPKLYDISFTLKIDETQAYAENTLPIFLAKTSTMHMNWVVQKGGQHFYMTFTLPSGKLISVNENGTLSNYISGQTCDKLFNGGIVFCPSNNSWADGYYLFHPQIQGKDEEVTVKLIYWIEELN